MEPYKLSYLSLKSILDNLKVEVVNGSFPVKDDDPETIQTNYHCLDITGVWPTEKRYDLMINGMYYKLFREEVEAHFNSLNSEIKYNLKVDSMKDSIPSYLEKITEELTKWFDSITELEINHNSNRKWIYLSKDNDQSFLKSKQLNDYMVEDISSIFRFIKNRSLEILESIHKFEDPSYGTKVADDTEELFPDISSQSSVKGLLDIYQTALLFFYLKKHQGINPVNYNSMAKYVSALTGYSEQNIRTNKGFGAIGDILSDKAKNQHHKDVPNYNLDIVKEFMQKIIDDIEAQIKRNNKP